LRVDVDEDDLDRHLVGLVGGDHLAHAVEDHLEALRQAALAAADHPLAT
jgi:hypothetical protein